MITNIKIQNIDLWEAWVDMQDTAEKTTATLYVIGDVCVNNAILEPRFEKVHNYPGLEGRLVLQIVPNILSEEGLDTEILYAEELDQPNQYSGITVLAGGEVVVEMDDLEYIY